MYVCYEDIEAENMKMSISSSNTLHDIILLSSQLASPSLTHGSSDELDNNLGGHENSFKLT